MATHSSILALRILWTDKPGRLWSIGLPSQTQLKLLGMQTPLFMSHSLPSELVQ